jgi:peptide/nickel transport system substrate-binding protein
MTTKKRCSNSHRSKDAAWRTAGSARVSRRKFIHMAGAAGGAGALWSLGAGLPPRAFAQAAKRGGTLRVATTKEAEVLDPSNIVSDVELRLCEQLFNGLVSIDENLSIVPDIAEEWAVTKDATHFEFKLRRGVLFHHGRELTADDVIFTIERFKDTWVSYVVRDLDTLTKLDDHTLRVTFKRPAAHFLGSMAPRWTGIVPRDVVEKVGKDAFKSQPVGTGAFRFTEHVPFQRLVTERNQDYFREGLPYVDRIEWIPVQDESARSAQVISGTVDVDPWAPLKLLDSFKSAEGVELVGGPTSRYEFADLNCGRAPFDNVDMRRAVSLATDRQAIVDLALLGEGEPLLGGPIGPPGHPFFTNLDTYANTPALDRARELVTSAGHGDGVEVQGIAESGSRYSDVLEILQQQWAAIGIDLKINAIEAGAARARRSGGDYDVAIQGWGTLVDPHDFTGENFYTGGGLNFGKCGDATLDGLLDEGVRATDQESRRKVYREVETYLLTEAVPYVFLYRPYEYTAFQSHVRGVKHEAGRTKISLEETWIDT